MHDKILIDVGRSEAAMAELPQVAALAVPEELRHGFLFAHLGFDSVRFEHTANSMLRAMCDSYAGGMWEFYHLTNGGFYMAPRVDTSLTLHCPGNGNTVSLSADGAGVAACAMALSHLSFRLPHDRLVTHFYRLQAYIAQHHEHRELRAALD